MRVAFCVQGPAQGHGAFPSATAAGRARGARGAPARPHGACGGCSGVCPGRSGWPSWRRSIWAFRRSSASPAPSSTTRPPSPIPRRCARRSARPSCASSAATAPLLAERGSAEAYVPIDMLPQHLLDAVVATEDRRFYEHWGLDPVGLARAAFANLRVGPLRAGRLDADPAARQEPVPQLGAHAHPQAGGAGAGAVAGGAARASATSSRSISTASTSAAAPTASRRRRSASSASRPAS